MIKSLLAILLVGLAALRYADLNSESALEAIVLPVLCMLSAIGLAVWFVILFYKLGVKQGGLSSYGGGIGGSGGGDGGGCKPAQTPWFQ
jgi:hypothetical protein